MFRESIQTNDMFVTVTEKICIMLTLTRAVGLWVDIQVMTVEYGCRSIVAYFRRSRATHPEPVSWL